MLNTISEVLLLLALFLLFLLISAFFSASETALLSVNKIRLFHAAEQGSRRAKKTRELVLNLDKLITTILVGNCLVNTAMAAIGTSVCIRLFGPEIGILIATFLVTVLLLIFGEITPKIFSISNADKTSLLVSYPMSWLMKVFNPVISIFTKISYGLVKLLGVEPRPRISLVSEEELRFMIEVGKEEGIYGDFERKMLHRIFEFGDLHIQDVMIPLKDMAVVPVTATDDDLFTVCVEEGHSRVPVYSETAEHIVGIIYAKDLLYLLLNDKLVKIPDILHDPFFVSPTLHVSALLKEFLRLKLQIAIVGDREKAVGLVTLADLLEEIVGKIDEDPQSKINPPTV